MNIDVIIVQKRALKAIVYVVHVSDQKTEMKRNSFNSKKGVHGVRNFLTPEGFTSVFRDILSWICKVFMALEIIIRSCKCKAMLLSPI